MDKTDVPDVLVSETFLRHDNIQYVPLLGCPGALPYIIDEIFRIGEELDRDATTVNRSDIPKHGRCTIEELNEGDKFWRQGGANESLSLVWIKFYRDGVSVLAGDKVNMPALSEQVVIVRKQWVGINNDPKGVLIQFRQLQNYGVVDSKYRGLVQTVNELGFFFLKLCSSETWESRQNSNWKSSRVLESHVSCMHMGRNYLNYG